MQSNENFENDRMSENDINYALLTPRPAPDGVDEEVVVIENPKKRRISDTEEMPYRTKSGIKARYKYACFTDFVQLNHENYFTNKMDNVSYGVAGYEICPDTKKPHIQGYVEFIKPINRDQIQTILGNKKMHVTERWATAQQAADYCKEDGTFTEVGTISKSEQGKRNDLIDIRDKIINGISDKDLVMEHTEDYARHYKCFDRWRYMFQPHRTWKTEVHILWGEPGCGKSHRAVLEEGGELISFENKFVLGYKNQEVVVLDDFNPGMIPLEFMLRLTDKYHMVVNVKGGEMTWNPKKIYITTNRNPEAWYGKAGQWLRRVTSVTKLGDDAYTGNNVDNIAGI